MNQLDKVEYKMDYMDASVRFGIIVQQLPESEWFKCSIYRLNNYCKKTFTSHPNPM